MPERVDYHPEPDVPEKYETPAAKNKRLREEREGWQEIDLDKPNQDDQEAA